MKHFLNVLLLFCISQYVLSVTTEEPMLGCFEDLQRGEYNESRDELTDSEWNMVINIRNNCTEPHDDLFGQLLAPFYGNYSEENDGDSIQFLLSITYNLISNYTHWEKLCQSGQEAIHCINSHQSHCSHSFGPWYLREGEAYFFSGLFWEIVRPFHSRTCTGLNVKDSLQNILHEQPDRDCIELDAIRTTCLDAWLREFVNYNTVFFYHPSEKQYRTKLSASILRCALDLLAESNCSEIQQNLHYQATKVLLPWTVDVDELDPNSTIGIDYSQIRRCTAGVYGDPHIKLCDADSLITCSSPGTQIYYRGPHLEIVGENTLVWSTSRATTVTNIDITFYSEDNSLVAQYQASNSQLPSTLVGGDSSAGPESGAVRVVTILADYRVDLVYDPLGLIIKLRRWGANYFFTMRAAKALFSAGSGLLVNGCPSSERLDITPANRVSRGVTTMECENACNSVLQTEFYEACVFDCTTMRTTDATVMTTQAMEMEDEVKLNDTELRRAAITLQASSNTSDTTSMTTSLTTSMTTSVTTSLNTSTTASAVTSTITSITTSAATNEDMVPAAWRGATIGITVVAGIALLALIFVAANQFVGNGRGSPKSSRGKHRGRRSGRRSGRRNRGRRPPRRDRRGSYRRDRRRNDNHRYYSSKNY